MPRVPNWIFAVVALLIVAGLGISRMEAPPVGESVSTLPSATGGTPVWSRGQDGAAQNVKRHWQKHGNEFPEFHAMKDYEQGALRFIRTPPPGTLTKHRANGDTLYYDPASNTFAVADSEGEPRTFFRPDSGRAYWDRQ